MPNAHRAWYHLAQTFSPFTRCSTHAILPSGLCSCCCPCLGYTYPRSLMACSFSSFRFQLKYHFLRPSLTTLILSTASKITSNFLPFPHQIPYSLFQHPTVNIFVDLFESIYNIVEHILTITTLQAEDS